MPTAPEAASARKNNINKAQRLRELGCVSEEIGASGEKGSGLWGAGGGSTGAGGLFSSFLGGAGAASAGGGGADEAAGPEEAEGRTTGFFRLGWGGFASATLEVGTGGGGAGGRGRGIAPMLFDRSGTVRINASSGADPEEEAGALEEGGKLLSCRVEVPSRTP